MLLNGFTYLTLSPAQVEAKFSLCAAQCTPIADGVMVCNRVTTPVRQPIIVAAPCVLTPLSFVMSNKASQLTPSG